MSYPKVYAAEKYAEIGGRENAPKCGCHEKPQTWGVNAGFPAGGHWRCQLALAARRRAKDKANGLCSWCHKRPIGVGLVSKCLECVDRHQAYRINRYRTDPAYRLRVKMKATLYFARTYVSAGLRDPEPDRETEVVGHVEMPIVNLRRAR